MLAQPAAPKPWPDIHVHSLIAGNGQHLVAPPRSGGMPWVGHKGRSPQAHPFAPTETFNMHAGNGVTMMPDPSPLVATTPAVITSITGQTVGTHQLAPGGGVYRPVSQVAPGRVGK